jgi:putative transposase
MRLLSFCLLPNHFHLVVWPQADDQLAPWMQWLLTAHVHGYRKRYRGSGHVWQGRFRAFPIEQDEHLLTVLRYVERNALRAGLVKRVEDWPWSSLPLWLQPPLLPWLDPGPVPRPPGWLEHVQAPHTEAELADLRRSVQRGCPFDSRLWVERAAAHWVWNPVSGQPVGRAKQGGRTPYKADCSAKNNPECPPFPSWLTSCFRTARTP